MATSKKKTPAGDKSDKPAKPGKDSVPASAKSKANSAEAPKAAKAAQAKPQKGKTPAPAAKGKAAAPVQPAKAKAPAPAPKNAPAGKDDDGISHPIKAIAAAKAGTSPRAGKKSSVAAFTLDDVRDVLKNRREEAREKAEKIEAAARKAAAVPVIEIAPEPKQRVLGAATLADILGFAMPNPVAKVVEAPKGREVPEKYRKFHELLTGLKEKVMRKLNQRGRMADVLGASSGSTLPPQNEDDDSFDHDFALSLVATEQEALIEIDAALERIYDGTYGICEITGREISPERLEAVPFTRYSVDGQAQFERMNRRRNQRSTSFMDSADDAGAFAGDEVDE